MLGSQLSPSIPSLETKKANDSKRSWGVVFLVLAVLALYAYVFTHAGSLIGLPLPKDAAASAGIEVEDVFDKDRNVKTSLWMDKAHEFRNNDGEMLAYYVLAAGAFLLAYFLPVAWKRDVLCLWTIGMVPILYGWRSLAYVLFAHFTTYLVFHPDKRRYPWAAALPGAALAFALGSDALSFGGFLFFLPSACLLAYRYVLRPLIEHERAGRILRACTANSLLFVLVIGGLLEGFGPYHGGVALGLLLFFAHWMRLILYYVDYENDLVPKDLSLRRYLATFLHPGEIVSWFIAVFPQGYAYTESVHLSEEKNRVALGGVKLLLIALVFMALGDWFTFRIAEFVGRYGMEVYWGDIRILIQYYVEGDRPGQHEVLLTSLLELARFTFFWAGVSHFKIGIWRICGFNVAPNFDKWMLSTDLLTLWRRYTFHYREFLVRAFYYPVFFRLSGWPLKLRVSAAIFAAAGAGNMIWGHAAERVLFRGAVVENLTFHFRRWPYFALLAGAIALTQLYMMWRKGKRKPWTPGPRILWDIGAAYLVIQFFALLHVFAWPPGEATFWDLWKIFLSGFGLRF